MMEELTGPYPCELRSTGGGTGRESDDRSARVRSSAQLKTRGGPKEGDRSEVA